MKAFASIKKTFIIVSGFSFFFSCVSENPSDKVENIVPQKVENIEEGVYSYQTTFDMEIGWGYDIYENGELRIHQPHIPAIQGKKGFSSEEKAIKCADFAIYKMKNGIVPPTISLQELDSLGVLEPKNN